MGNADISWDCLELQSSPDNIILYITNVGFFYRTKGHVCVYIYI